MAIFRISVVGLALVVAAAPFVTNQFFATASEPDAVDVLDAEFDQTVRLLEELRGARLDVLEMNYDAEVAALEAAHGAEVDAIGQAYVTDRADLDASHEDRLVAIDSARDARFAELDADFASSVAMIEVMHAELVAQLDLEGLSKDDIKDVYKAAISDAKDAMDAELDALETAFDADMDAADAEFEGLEDGLEAEFDAIDDQFKAAESVLKDAEHAALEVHKDRTDALLAPYEAEKKYWEDEKKAIEHAIGLIFKPLLDELKDKGKQDTQQYEDLNDEYKFEKLDQTVLQRAMIEEMKSIIDEIKDAQKVIENQIKADFDAEFALLDAARDADVADVEAQFDAAEAAYEANVESLEADFDTAEASIEDSYETLIDTLKDQEELAVDYIEVQTLRFGDLRDDGRHRADAVREAARNAENDSYEHAKKVLERDSESAERAADRAFESASDDAESRYDQAVAQVERNHARNIDMAESEHFILRERVRSFLASDGLVPMAEYYDPQSDPGSMFNVARSIKADHEDYTGSGVQVALIDTGIVDVEGLRSSNVVIGPDFSFEDISEDLRARDTNGHGTHLAGIIAGSDPEFVAGDTQRRPERALGIAPAAELVSIKVGAADGAVDVTQVIAAIDWVIAANASGEFDIRVISLAYGTNGTQDYEIDPLSYTVERAWHAGIVVVVAAGNDGLDANALTNPATNPYVIAVGSGQPKNGHDLILSGYTNAGSGHGVDIVAPGRSIASLRNPGSAADTAQTQLDGATLVRGSGTSQAAAVVTGVVALMLQERPELTPDQVKWLLMDTAKESRDPAAGAGFIDANKAIGHNLPSDSAEYTQTWATSNGSGSIDAARGDMRVTIDGVVLEGEQDIFGNSWTGNSWTGNSWTGNSWTGNSWTGNSWTGNSWTGNSWTGNSWTGNSWTSLVWGS